MMQKLGKAIQILLILYILVTSIANPLFLKRLLVYLLLKMAMFILLVLLCVQLLVF